MNESEAISIGKSNADTAVDQMNAFPTDGGEHCGSQAEAAHDAYLQNVWDTVSELANSQDNVRDLAEIAADAFEAEFKRQAPTAKGWFDEHNDWVADPSADNGGAA